MCLDFRMYGLFQTTFYFGYMALFSVGLGIMCGEYHLVISRTDLLWLRPQLKAG